MHHHFGPAEVCRKGDARRLDQRKINVLPFEKLQFTNDEIRAGAAGETRAAHKNGCRAGARPDRKMVEGEMLRLPRSFDLHRLELWRSKITQLKFPRVVQIRQS